MSPLKVVAVDAPPMARYDPEQQTYNGIATDILCFITRELGLEFNITPGRDETTADKIRQVQEGLADVFIPLSLSPERAKRGLFTLPYYESHYAVIARHESAAASIRSMADLANYHIGYVQGVSFEPMLQATVPARQLHVFNQSSSDGLFQAAVDGKIDAVVFNQDIFIEKRYRQEFFDLEIVHTLGEYPRAYRYYFRQSLEYQQLVRIFDLYLDAIDVSASINKHKTGERVFLERYAAQRDRQSFLLLAIGAALLLALIFCLALLRYRRLTRLLTESNTQIQQQQQALQLAYQQVEALSLTDSLTGLSNRRHFDQMLRYEYTRYQRTGSPLSLLVIDVDHFKKVNDHYGHAVGDEYLQTIARVLENSVIRSTDLVARYGGEEFTCLLTDTASEDARLVAQRIQRGIAGHNLPNPLAVPSRLTLSIGISTVLTGAPDVQGLFDLADAQLYLAKQTGRNRICATTFGN